MFSHNLPVWVASTLQQTSYIFVDNNFRNVRKTKYIIFILMCSYLNMVRSLSRGLAVSILPQHSVSFGT
jgi:hypothetical protein